MLQVLAPAKVNLYLHLIGKRADGYHLLDTLVTFPAIGDMLSFTASDLLTLRVEGEFADAAGQTGDNLVLRAARALNEATGQQRGASIHLTKNIPVGAGLGGGSSDAAATLKALNELWELGLRFEQLLELGAQLGADVPMCLFGKPLYARGVGEEIQVATLPSTTAWIVLVHPRVSVLTKDIFAAIDPDIFSQSLFQSRSTVRHVMDDRNHLQPIAVQRYPVIQQVLDALYEAAIPPGAVSDAVLAVRMSGSGACCFALFLREDEARACAARMQQAHPDWWVRSASTVVAN
jgi:4-diphosphocytidyl-2-C-methyl-D-erythritol kinase